MAKRDDSVRGARRGQGRSPAAVRVLALALAWAEVSPAAAQPPVALPAPAATEGVPPPPAAPPGFVLRSAGAGRWAGRHADGVTLEWTRLPLRRRWDAPADWAAAEAGRLAAELGPDARVDVLDAVMEDGVLTVRLRPRLGGAAAVATLRVWSTAGGSLRLRLVGPESRGAALDDHLEAILAALAAQDLPAGELPPPPALVLGGCRAPAGAEPLLPSEEAAALALLGPAPGPVCAAAVERRGARPVLLRWCALSVELPALGAAGGPAAAEAALGLWPLDIRGDELRVAGARLVPSGPGAVVVEALALPDDAPPEADPLRPDCAPPAPTRIAELRRAWGLRPRAALITVGALLVVAAGALVRRPTA